VLCNNNSYINDGGCANSVSLLSTTSSVMLSAQRDIRRRTRGGRRFRWFPSSPSLTVNSQHSFGSNVALQRHTALAMSVSGGDSSNNNDNNINSKRLFFMTRQKFLVAVQSFVLASPLLVEIYSRLGSIFPNTQLPSGQDLIMPSSEGNVDWNNVRHITLVFHGAGGQDVYTDELMKNLKDLSRDNEENSRRGSDSDSTTARSAITTSSSSSSSNYCQIIDWSNYSTNLFQASFNGEAIGRNVAKYLSRKATNVETVHLIGISVGAFAANMAASEWKQKQQEEEEEDSRSIMNSRGGSQKTTTTTTAAAVPVVQLTLLDPFTQRGIWGFGYGNRNFGASKNIDYTHQYLNRDDPVPSTNEPLQYAVCYDVTSIRPAEIFGHDWPLVYYARHLTVKEDNAKRSVVGIVPRDQRKPPGQVITIQ
jgi:Lipase